MGVCAICSSSIVGHNFPFGSCHCFASVEEFVSCPHYCATIDQIWLGFRGRGVTLDRQNRIEIVALVGSMREQSYNRGLLRTAMLLQPEDVHIAEFPVSALPYFNPDHVDAQHLPTVQDFRQRLRLADAVLICTPEYAASIPGMLKNALDWAATPKGRSPLRGKPVGIASASIDRTGTVRTQMHLRQVFQSMGAICIPEPEVYVTFAEDKFNPLGELTDQTGRDQVKQLVEQLADWVQLLRDLR